MSNTAATKAEEKGCDADVTTAPESPKRELACGRVNGVNMWFSEYLTPNVQIRSSLKNIMFQGQSKFQRLQVIETGEFGKTLVMDGCTQSAKLDEHIYHESLVHPAMLSHPNPKRVFIGGGGEFATAREVLRHASVERCVMIDLDKEACDICRKELPEWNDGAYEDPRLFVDYQDARKWLEDNEKETFDVIIMDICDPIEAGPGYVLYTQEFYKFLRSRLNENGVIVTQSGPGAFYNVSSECFTVIHSTLRSEYGEGNVAPYAVDIPSFGCNWGFNMVHVDRDAAAASRSLLMSLLDLPMDEVDDRIAKRLKKGHVLKFLDGVSWRGIFGVAKEIRAACKRETRIMTKENPVFMFG